MIGRKSVARVLAAGLVSFSFIGCGDALDSLTSHSRPAATALGESLDSRELGIILADSPTPDSALDGQFAAAVARLWADYVVLARLYQEPDSSESLDYDPLLEAGRYYSVLEVANYRDSVLLAGIEPSDEEIRDFFETAQPLTRLDVRRISLGVPEGSSDAVRDSLFSLATDIRERVAGGADFVEMARQYDREPAAARGQVIAYQGHTDFAPVADSVVFALAPGEISPVFATGDEMVFYRVERRRAPELEQVTDMLRERLIAERTYTRLSTTADSLLEGSRRTVADGAEQVARDVATAPAMAADRISGNLKLVRYEGGDFEVQELRNLFRVRPDLKLRFEQAEEDEQIALMLYQLAGDEVLIDAASSSGVGISQEARDRLRWGIGLQMGAIAQRLGISHAMVSDPRFDMQAESRRFLTSVLQASRPVPWLTEFRIALDPVYPSRVDERGSETAARIARDRRGSTSSPETAPESAATEEDAH